MAYKHVTILEYIAAWLGHELPILLETNNVIEKSVFLELYLCVIAHELLVITITSYFDVKQLNIN